MSVGSIDPGCIRLHLDCAGGRINKVSVVSARPVIAQQLRGRMADEAVRLVPLLFALCGKAQGRAAILALEAARGKESPVHLDPLIEQEVLREHLWHWLLDLPTLQGEAPLRDEFMSANRWIAMGQREALAELLCGRRLQAMIARFEDTAGAQDVLESAPRLLPPLVAQDSLAQWPQLDSGFCQSPHWQDRAVETGALARRQDRVNGPQWAFAARWLARLDELRDWAGDTAKLGAGGTASAVPVEPGRGRALVETARGMLMHEIVLDGDRIADYFIVAPTEWNFHLQGPLPDWLTGRDASDREAVRGFVARAVAALDPCVRWELEWL
ncbi:MAG: nickel-dependent hydrogenase large subunit [Sulfuritalea sp.]|nr:nickel-dependent hydrogenase large subunit [Sulfuritalea sp.]